MAKGEGVAGPDSIADFKKSCARRVVAASPVARGTLKEIHVSLNGLRGIVTAGPDCAIICIIDVLPIVYAELSF